MNILFYFETHKNLRSQNLGGIELLNIDLYNQIKKVETETLNNIIVNSNFANKRIDFLSIDVEGNELNVLKGFDLKKYKPTIVLLEYRLPNLKEFHDKNIDQIIESEIYHHMTSSGYKLINWNHDDLMFMYQK
mgnify:CR=1 FL=1